MTRLVDLDDPAMVERAVDELRRVHAIRQIDPRLRGAIERRADESVQQGRSTDEQRDQIQRQLDELHPDIVLEAWFNDLIPSADVVDGWFS